MDAKGLIEILPGLVDRIDKILKRNDIGEIVEKDWREVRREIRDFLKNYQQRVEEASRLRIGIVGQIKEQFSELHSIRL